MFYIKNIPTAERIVRGLAGAAMIAFELLGGIGQPKLGYLIAAAGLMVSMTGFIGFCPLCAMVGRKVKHAAKEPSGQ